MTGKQVYKFLFFRMLFFLFVALAWKVSSVLPQSRQKSDSWKMIHKKKSRNCSQDVEVVRKWMQFTCIVITAIL